MRYRSAVLCESVSLNQFTAAVSRKFLLSFESKHSNGFSLVNNIDSIDCILAQPNLAPTRAKRLSSHTEPATLAACDLKI